jgi:hypothetical protein
VEFRASDPDQLAEGLGSVVDEVSVRSTRRSGFDARVCLAPLPRVALFTVSIGHARVLQPAPRGFVGFTLPLAGLFEVHECSRVESFSAGSFHLARSREPFDLRAPRDMRVLVAHLDNSMLQEHAQSFDAPRGWSDHIRSRHSTEEPEWASVPGFLRFVWHELNREGAIVRSPLVATDRIEPEWRGGLVGFVGLGWTAGGTSDDNGPFAAGGGGIRYLLARRLGMQVGVDVARGPEDTAFHIIVGSAW